MSNKKKPYRDYSDDSWFTNLMKFARVFDTSCCWWTIAAMLSASILLASIVAAAARRLF